mmetsp:Transcript_32080/g.105025  ORF Transcript_32080/g.105025 Transcript_32080/m.105025 type:complete len:347 (-) Transcript_32080:314-1354(-)
MERSAPKVASGRATWRCSIDKEDELAREYLRSKEPATLYGTRVNEAAMEMHNGAGDGLGRDGPKGLGARVAMEALDRVVRSHSEFKLEVLSESGGLKGGSGSGAKRFYKPGERARREASTREGGGGVGGRGGGRGVGVGAPPQSALAGAAAQPLLLLRAPPMEAGSSAAVSGGGGAGSSLGRPAEPRRSPRFVGETTPAAQGRVGANDSQEPTNVPPHQKPAEKELSSSTEMGEEGGAQPVVKRLIMDESAAGQPDAKRGRCNPSGAASAPPRAESSAGSSSADNNIITSLLAQSPSSSTGPEEVKYRRFLSWCSRNLKQDALSAMSKDQLTSFLLALFTTLKDPQ